MALINSSEHKLSSSKRYLKPLMLRDYLLDDLSSCSSNGFKSFPRRQCCSTSVRFLLQTEIKRPTISNGRHLKPRLTRSGTTCGTAFGIAVQKASTTLLKAVKRSLFPSSVNVKLPPSTPRGKGVLSRSFSKRLLGRRFRRKYDNRYRRGLDDEDYSEIGRRKDSYHRCGGDHRVRQIQQPKSFADFLRESPDQSSDHHMSSISTATSSAADAEATDSALAAPAAAAVDIFADSSNSSIKNGENSGDESKFLTNSNFVHSLTSGAWISEASNETDGGEDESETSGEIKMACERIDSHVGDGSVVNSSRSTEVKREERVNEGKEQFSPVSVLDCQFEDDEDSTSTVPCHQHFPVVKEINKKLMKKSRRRFRSLTQLEPMDLEKRIKWYTQTQDSPPYRNHISAEKVETDEQAYRLVDIVKAKINEPNTLLLLKIVENLLLDFFQEDTNETTNAETLIKIAEDWVMGRPYEIFLSWEVKENREVYVREMERKEKWQRSLVEEKEVVVKELEDVFFTTLVEELMHG